MKLTKTQKIILIIVLIAGAILTYFPHLDYPYPIHVDEWGTILQAEYLSQGVLLEHPTLEIFPNFIILLISKIGINIILFFKFLPAILIILTSLILFKLTYYLTKNFTASIFSIIFLISLPSNTNLLGFWFFTPFIASIPFVFLTIFLYLKAYNEINKKIFIYVIISFLILSITYPPYAIFTFLILGIYTLMNTKKENLKKLKKHLIIFTSILIILVIIFLIIFSKSPTWIFSQLIFQHGHSPLEPGTNANSYISTLSNIKILINPYFLPILFGIIPFILAMLGLYKSYKSNPKNILLIWFITSLILISIFLIFNFTIIMSYQRIIFMTLLSLVLLAGIGTSTFLNYLKKYPKYITTILIILILILTFYNYGKSIQGTEIYHLIDNGDYKAIQFLSTLNKSYVLTDPEKALPIIIITHHQPVAGIAFIGSEEQKEMTKKFFNSNCQDKSKILKKHNYIDYIFTKSRIECENFKLIYSKPYIYSVR